MAETIGGYEVIRRVASGAVGEVMLARPPIEAMSVAPGVAAHGDDGSADDLQVAIKVPRIRSDRADELLALDAARSDHVVRLLDVVTLEDGRTGLVLEALEPTSLADLLIDRSRLRPGEAVTILISAARGLTALHAAGWTHGAVGAGALLFRRDGTPVLVGLGGARRLDPDGLAIDRAAWARLAGSLLPTLPLAVQQELALGEGDIADAAERLFAFAEPIPVERLGEGAGAPRHRRNVEEAWTHIPGRGIAVQVPELARADAPTQPVRHGGFRMGARRSGIDRTTATARVSPHAGALTRLSGQDDSPQPTRSWRLPLLDERVLPALRTVRPRFWVLAAGGALALLAAGLAVPLEDPAAGEALRGSAEPAVAGSTAQEAVPMPAPSGAAGTEGGEGSAGLLAPGDAAIIGAIVGDDPAAAARALLARRAECARGGATQDSDVSKILSCVAGVAQPGSAQEAADRAALEAGEPLTAVPADGEPQVQRMGDAALVTFDTSAVLVVRTDEGWRVRDRFARSP